MDFFKVGKTFKSYGVVTAKSRAKHGAQKERGEDKNNNKI